MEMILGWLSAEAARASRSNLRTRSGSDMASGARTLIATGRPRLICVARYTSPMPPAPSGDRISYKPSLAPLPSAIYAEQLYRGYPMQLVSARIERVAVTRPLAQIGAKRLFPDDEPSGSTM